MRYYDFDKTAARREFRKRNYIFLGVFVGAIPAISVLSWLLRLFGFERVSTSIFVPLMIVWVGVCIWRTYWTCPRCHNNFFRKWWGTDVISMHCLHCGLRPNDLIEDFIPKDR